MKDPGMEGEIEQRRFFVVQVPLINDQTYMLCGSWVQSTGCGVSGRYLEFKTRNIRGGTLFFKYYY
jgi:hypothetical protein